VAGVALGKALCALGYNAHLKWPNDVLLETGEGMRKVAGILAEMASEGQQVRSIVLGLGINVTSTNFPPDLRSRATSLRLASGCTLDRGDLLAAFLNAFEPLFDGLVAHGPADGLSQWRRFACLGQSCWVERGSLRIKGIAEDVDASGALVLRIASGEQISIHAGEVNWLPSV
jgi:BirA family biotin operon repressor/biotin-[acetyl-CoA-carboxylase] ligase